MRELNNPLAVGAAQRTFSEALFHESSNYKLIVQQLINQPVTVIAILLLNPCVTGVTGLFINCFVGFSGLFAWALSNNKLGGGI